MKLDILNDNIKKLIIRLALPTIGGMLSITLFNITDTYFVSRLGLDSLAAMGVTFPIVMLVGAISSGICAGAGSLLSRAKGSGDIHKIRRIATDGILLSLIFVACVSVAGLLTMNPVFRFLGADDTTLPLVKQYMTTWYMFVVVVFMPPVVDSSMRASGDMVRPFVVMMVCAVINVILDPLLIFGIGPFPELGIKGAVIATIIARACGMVTTLAFAHFHHHFIDFKYENIKELFESWTGILKIGLPNTIVTLTPQVLRIVLTAIAGAVAGKVALAALATGTKVESFALIIVYAFGISLIPIIGQNWGAKKFERVEQTRKLAIKFAVIYGISSFILALLLGKFIAKIFVDNQAAIAYTSQYLIIMLFASTGLNVTNWLSQAFSTIGKPIYSLLINVLGTLFIIIPLLYLCSIIYGFTGMLIGVAIGQLIVGFITVVISKSKLKP